jgi:hypothetical protein
MKECNDCHIDLAVIPKVQQKKWDSESLCQPCFSIRLARYNGLVPIDCGHWVSMDMAVKHYVGLKEGEEQC